MIKASEILMWLVMSLLLIGRRKDAAVSKEVNSFEMVASCSTAARVNPSARCLDMESNYYGGLPFANKNKKESTERRREEDRRSGV